MRRTALKLIRTAIDYIASKVGFRQSEARIRSDAVSFWENSSTEGFGENSHWRGCGIFEEDDTRWFSIGRDHLELFGRLSKSSSVSIPESPSVLEWGCGGGANAVAFAPMSRRYVGVDISMHSIEECLRQVKLIGDFEAVGVLADIHHPEYVSTKVDPVDVVICTYVFELLPTKEYALRLLRVFFDLLKSGGVALIQIRYSTTKFSTHGRNWGYKSGFAKMVSFQIDEFWKDCKDAGFTPKCLTLVPEDSTVFDERYAYFLIEKSQD